MSIETVEKRSPSKGWGQAGKYLVLTVGAVLTRGGPGDETRTAVMVIYESAFQQLEFGLASAIGVVLTVLIIVVTAIQFQLSKRYVFYG